MTPVDRVRSFILSATRTLRFVAPVALLAAMAPAPRAAVSPEPISPAAAPQAAVAVPETSDALASFRRDVRLRKLHLVRPDLIQYPLSYDVFC